MLRVAAASTRGWTLVVLPPIASPLPQQAPRSVSGAHDHRPTRRQFPLCRRKCPPFSYADADGREGPPAPNGAPCVRCTSGRRQFLSRNPGGSREKVQKGGSANPLFRKP